MKMRERIGAWILWGAALIATPTGARAQGHDVADLEARLQRLVATLEAEREAQHVPGLALAVVLDDKVILARGFGLANVEEQTPITPETVFSIGSTTKAFTATLTAMLVDEGLVGWDDPVTAYLPWFTLHARRDDKPGVVTLRDMASHQTGFTRMRALYAGPGVERETALRAAARAEPLADQRERFLYTNIMYLALGEAIGAAAKSDWDTLVEQRLLAPLGMAGATTRDAVAADDARRAIGYEWREDRRGFRRVALRNVDTIAPAGGISASALDMARWLRFQLGRGELDGRRLLSETAHAETWKPQVEVADGVQYGFGWMIRSWRGQRVIEHGGNVDGFSCEVAMLPDSKLGFVLCANAGAAPVADAMDLVWETVLGETSEAKRDVQGEPSAAEIDLRPFVGAYRANYGAHVDDTFRVLLQDEMLAIDFAGKQTSALRAPDEGGRWAIALNPRLAVSFVADTEGRMVEMVLHQGTMAFTLPRLDLDLSPEVPLAAIEKYLGAYVTEDGGDEFAVVIKDDCLALDAPGPKVYQLRAPDAEGRWFFRVVDWCHVSFAEDDAGEVEGLTFTQRGEATVMRRRIEEQGAERPTMANLLALRDTAARRAALEELGAFCMTGTVRLVHAGVEGKITVHATADGRHRRDLDFGVFGAARVLVDRDRAWIVDLNGRADERTGKSLSLLQRDHPAAVFGDWTAFFSSLAYVRTADRDGRPTHVVRAGGDELPDTELYVDAASGDVVAAESVAVHPDSPLRLSSTMRYEDYRDVAGLRVPFRVITRNEAVGEIVFQFVEFARLEEVDEDLFRAKETDAR